MQSTFRSTAHVARVLLVASLGLAAASLGGCSTAEVYTYTSDAHSPKSVTITDTATGEKVWTCDIPVGQKLDMRFANRPPATEERGSDELAWSLSGVDSKSKGRRNIVQVPPVSRRRIDMTLRPAPELK
ncbi:MAG: hypothetical protein WCK33_08670 [Phycisphaerae bacterium]